MKKIVVILLLFIFLTGCGNSKKANSLEDVIRENNYIVLDVRTSEEYREGHVVNSLNIPYDEIDENIDLDKSKTILVYCRSGNRSGIAYDTLKSLGYDVMDLGSFDSIILEKE